MEIASSDQPLALSVKDFCRRMSISPSTFWKHVRAGKIRVFRLGGRTLVAAAEIARLVSEGRQ